MKKKTINIEETEKSMFEVFDYAYRGEFATLKEARADYRKAREEYGQAELFKTTVRTTIITRHLQSH